MIFVDKEITITVRAMYQIDLTPDNVTFTCEEFSIPLKPSEVEPSGWNKVLPIPKQYLSQEIIQQFREQALKEVGLIDA